MAVLVVDDSSAIRTIIKGSLNKIGFDDVVLAEDGVVALNKLQSYDDINLIITDWNMPNMNGYEFVEKVRGNSSYSKVPILMVTTEGGKKEVLSALKLGVNGYIVKPFSKELLEEKIKNLMGI
jgi:two-component system chemotaxis response regulator CheY